MSAPATPPLWAKSELHGAALAWLESCPSDRPWLVAFSGGADSLALLLTLWQLWPERRHRLVAMHFNHALRGPESEEDEVFCRAVAARLGVKLEVGRWANPATEVSEAEARTARREFFSQVLAAHPGGVICTGHHRDDVAETLLMRLARGAGTAGLAAPRPVQAGPLGAVVLRPLLNLTRIQIADALHAAGERWREDSSNQERRYFRNRVRRDVVPAWMDAAERDAIQGAARSRELLEEDDDALATWAAAVAQTLPMGEGHLPVKPLRALPRGLLRRILYLWEPTRSLARPGFDEVLHALAQGRGQVSHGDGWVVVENDLLSWVQAPVPTPWAAVPLPTGGGVALPDGAWVACQAGPLDPGERERVLAGQVHGEGEAWLAYEGGLEVRFWQPGDRFQPLGRSSASKLQDLFVNQKIPAEQRQRLPLVAIPRGEIIWIPGFPPAERYKLLPHTLSGVHLTYSPGTFTV